MCFEKISRMDFSCPASAQLLLQHCNCKKVVSSNPPSSFRNLGDPKFGIRTRLSVGISSLILILRSWTTRLLHLLQLFHNISRLQNSKTMSNHDILRPYVCCILKEVGFHTVDYAAVETLTEIFQSCEYC